MIVGVVADGQEPIVYVEVIGPTNLSDFVRLVVDTGFTGALVLPQSTIDFLKLRPRATAKLRLGDGTLVEMDEYSAEVVWHGQRRVVTVIASVGETLLGMRMLQGSRLTLDAIDRGELTIHPLESVTP